MSGNEEPQILSGEESAYSSSDGSSGESSGTDNMMSKHEFKTLQQIWTTMTNRGERLYANYLLKIEGLVKSDRMHDEIAKKTKAAFEESR